MRAGNGKSLQQQKTEYELEAARLRSERDECFSRIEEITARLEAVAEKLAKLPCLQISKNQG